MSGFKSGKELLRFLLELKDNKDNDLFDFTSDFFRALKEANPQREENQTTEDKKVLDTLARLLVGDEICSACCVSLSGDRIVLATNKPLHIDDSIKHIKKIMVHESPNKKLRCEFEVIDYMEFRGSSVPQTKKASKSSGVVVYERRVPKDKFKLVTGNPNIVFTQEEHTFSFPNQQNVTLSFTATFRSFGKWYKIVKKLPVGVEIDLFRPITNQLNPLRRRASKLLRNLSLIANSILHDPHSERQVSHIMEKNKQWPQFLNDSLTYELSLQKPYSTHVNTSSYEDKGTRMMLEFYEWLIDNYQQYKNRMGITTSVASVKAWLSDINEWIMQPATPAPVFIKSKPEQFIKLLRRYLIDLASVEELVRKDASKNGRFSNIIKKTNLFKDEIPVVVIDGVPEVHAEMRLLEEHLNHNPNLSNYYGITMLCCALCTYTLKQLGVAEYRGSHSILYDNWIFIDVIKNRFLDRFLGATLFQKLVALRKKRCFPPGAARVKGNDVQQSDLALEIIPSVKKINNKEAFNKLRISEEYLLTSSSEGIEMYYKDDTETSASPFARSDGKDYGMEHSHEPYLESDSVSIQWNSHIVSQDVLSDMEKKLFQTSAILPTKSSEYRDKAIILEGKFRQIRDSPSLSICSEPVKINGTFTNQSQGTGPKFFSLKKKSIVQKSESVESPLKTDISNLLAIYVKSESPDAELVAMTNQALNSKGSNIELLEAIKIVLKSNIEEFNFISPQLCL